MEQPHEDANGPAGDADDPGDAPGDPDDPAEATGDRGASAVEHVLSSVFPDRLSASVEGTAPTERGLLVGVKADPRGYFSTAKYALVTVAEDGQILEGEAVTGSELRRALERENDRGP